MDSFDKESLRGFGRRGLELTRHLALVVLATTFLAIAEPYLIPTSMIATSLSQSLWHSLKGIFASQTFVLLVLGICLVKTAVLCWFTSRAFQVRNSLRYSFGQFLPYVGRVIILEIAIYLSFGGFAGLIVFMSAHLIYPTSPALEKVTIFVVGAALLPVFVAILSFTSYWSYTPRSLLDTARSIGRGLRKHARAVYLFSAARTLIDMGCGLVIPIILLRMPLPFIVNFCASALVLSIVFTWLRGVGFEFNNSLFWDESSHQIKS